MLVDKFGRKGKMGGQERYSHFKLMKRGMWKPQPFELVIRTWIFILHPPAPGGFPIQQCVNEPTGT